MPFDTLFTTYLPDTKSYVPRYHRPALVVTSTSWTDDEDFDLLLEALLLLDHDIHRRQSSSSLSSSMLKVMVLVTGKGPLKEYYMHRIRTELHLIHIVIQSMWLSPTDYPMLLACADIGISLHTSTSGLDLPMKILDLYGCGTPVCAVQYESSLQELVTDDYHGRIFTSSQELAKQLLELLSPLSNEDTSSSGSSISTTSRGVDDDALIPASSSQQNPSNMGPIRLQPHGFGDLQRYSENILHGQVNHSNRPWHTNWTQHALPVLNQAIINGLIVLKPKSDVYHTNKRKVE
jgi:hypothetical protein